VNAGPQLALVWSLVAMAGIVLAVWLRLYHLRLGEMRRSRIHPQKLALSGPKDGLLLDTRASDNFKNLFELPLLSQSGVLLVLVLGLASPFFAVLAWIFVATRALHSLIQCTYNRVMHRFTVYAAGTLVLWVFWFGIAWQLIR
jgi:hypothetical protein